MSEAERVSAVEFSDENRALIVALRGVLAGRAPAVLGNRRMLLGLLRDHAPDQARTIRLVMAAFDNDAPSRLRSGRPLASETLDSEASALSQDAGLREDLARLAIRIWAAALLPEATLAPPVPKGLAPSPGPAPAEDLTWSTPVGPAPAAAVPALPVASKAAADDMTWSTPVAPAATPEAPSWSPPAPAAPVLTAAPASGSLKGRLALGGVVGVVVCVALVSLLNQLGVFKDAPANAPAPEPTQAQAPTVPTHGGGAATIVGTMPDGQPIVLASDSNDLANWPILPSASHFDGNLNSWRFSTGIKYADGRVFLYQTEIKMAAGLASGVASTAAVNLSTATGKNPVSLSKLANVTRSLDPSGVYRIDMTFANWQTDAANAPKVCMVFTLEATPARFEPQVFCATAAVNGACTPTYIGCGYFH